LTYLYQSSVESVSYSSLLVAMMAPGAMSQSDQVFLTQGFESSKTLVPLTQKNLRAKI